MKKNDIFCSKYNYYYDNIYNNTNDGEIHDYFKYVMKFKKTCESYDIFVNAKKQFLTGIPHLILLLFIHNLLNIIIKFICIYSIVKLVTHNIYASI